jgi:hypothetical protein
MPSLVISRSYERRPTQLIRWRFSQPQVVNTALRTLDAGKTTAQQRETER